jgi:hypothetical protein
VQVGAVLTLNIKRVATLDGRIVARWVVADW